MSDSKIDEIEKKIGKLDYKFKLLEDINKNTLIINKKIEGISLDLEDIKKKIEDNIVNVSNLNKKVNTLEAENRVMKDQLSMIRMELEEIKFEKISNDIEIIGMPNCSKNQIKQKIIDQGKKINCTIKQEDILNVTKKEIKQKNSNIFCLTVTNNQMKQNILASFKKSKPTGSDFGYTNCNNRIFFNEALTNYTRNLLYHARELKKQKNFKWLWTKNGKILLRQTDQSKIINIKSINDIEILLK